MQPARFHRCYGSHFDIAFFRNFKSKACQKVHPTFRFKLESAKMRKTRHNPGIVRHKYIKTRTALFKHHLAHLLRTFMQRIKCIMLASIKPLANSLVKAIA